MSLFGVNFKLGGSCQLVSGQLSVVSDGFFGNKKSPGRAVSSC